jgi:hypothetical protein
MPPIDKFFIAYSKRNYFSKRNYSFEDRFFIPFSVIVGLVKNMLIFSLFKRTLQATGDMSYIRTERSVAHAASHAVDITQPAVQENLTTHQPSPHLRHGTPPLRPNTPQPPTGIPPTCWGANRNRCKISHLISSTDTLCQGAVCNYRFAKVLFATIEIITVMRAKVLFATIEIITVMRVLASSP